MEVLSVKGLLKTGVLLMKGQLLLMRKSALVIGRLIPLLARIKSKRLSAVI
jgi:hypothetical protein